MSADGTSSSSNIQNQLQSLNQFISLIQDKTIEYSLRLSKQSSVSVNGRTFKRKQLTAKQWRELSRLNSQMATASDELTRLDLLIEVRTKAAEYYFGIPPDIFDQNYEKLSPLIEGCILRSNTGLSPDIDLDKLLYEYQQQQQQQQSNGHGTITATTTTTTTANTTNKKKKEINNKNAWNK